MDTKAFREGIENIHPAVRSLMENKTADEQTCIFMSVYWLLSEEATNIIRETAKKLISERNTQPK